jgi:hypothetical protein
MGSCYREMNESTPFPGDHKATGAKIGR